MARSVHDTARADPRFMKYCDLVHAAGGPFLSEEAARILKENGNDWHFLGRVEEFHKVWYSAEEEGVWEELRAREAILAKARAKVEAKKKTKEKR